jgi:hypothetical protein
MLGGKEADWVIVYKGASNLNHPGAQSRSKSVNELNTQCSTSKMEWQAVKSVLASVSPIVYSQTRREGFFDVPTTWHTNFSTIAKYKYILNTCTDIQPIHISTGYPQHLLLN